MRLSPLLLRHNGAPHCLLAQWRSLFCLVSHNDIFYSALFLTLTLSILPCFTQYLHSPSPFLLNTVPSPLLLFHSIQYRHHPSFPFPLNTVSYHSSFFHAMAVAFLKVSIDHSVHGKRRTSIVQGNRTAQRAVLRGSPSAERPRPVPAWKRSTFPVPLRTCVPTGHALARHVAPASQSAPP